MTRVVVMMGAPGAGKGTQAARLSSTLSLPHVSTGDLFRENLSQGTPLGQEARGYMDSGRLVPDELVLSMLFDRVAREDCAAGYLLDGFPRTVPQAEKLSERMNGSTVTVVDLEVPEAVIIDRAAGRLLCRGCDRIAHAEFAPPAKEGICDHCGGELYQRKDDQPEVVRQRLVTYHEQTLPVVGWYRERDGVCTVDGTRTPDEVFADCLACVGGEG